MACGTPRGTESVLLVYILLVYYSGKDMQEKGLANPLGKVFIFDEEIYFLL